MSGAGRMPNNPKGQAMLDRLVEVERVEVVGARRAACGHKKWVGRVLNALSGQFGVSLL